MPADYVNKLARMFQDIKVSEDLNSEFKESTRNNNEGIAGMCLSGSVIIFTPQPLRAVGVLFSPRREIVCPGCISETVRCRKFILGRDIGWRGVFVQRHGLTLI